MGKARALAATAAIEVYPGPGIETYRSTLYAVEVFDGANWIPAYVYQFRRKSVTHWHYGESPSVSFTTFGTSGPVDVRVTRLGGGIASVDASPKSKPIAGGRITAGRAIGTVTPGSKFWLTINGDDANPLFIFADPLKPDVPAGATYFGPGVHEIAPAAGNHYKASTGEILYLDGGAWVRGNVDVRGTTDVRIMGPGILSGDLWTGETVGSTALPFDEFTNYAMIHGDWIPGNHASVEGITIVDSPGYNFFSGAHRASGIKIISPWFYSTDGFQGVSHVTQSFVFNGDNVFMPGWAGAQGENITITSCFAATSLNAVFSGGYWGHDPGSPYTSLAEDIDIRSYNNDDWGPLLLAAVFQIWMDNSDGRKGFAHQTYRNIRIEGPLSTPLLDLKNVVYPWGGPTAVSPPLGNAYDIVFQDVSFVGTQKYRSEIKGWDAQDGFHDVVLDDFSFNGEIVGPQNLAKYFDVNAYVWGLGFTAPETPCAGDDRPPGAGETARAPVLPVDGPCAAVSVARPR